MDIHLRSFYLVLLLISNSSREEPFPQPVVVQPLREEESPFVVDLVVSNLVPLYVTLDDATVHDAHVSVVDPRLYHPVHEIQGVQFHEQLFELRIQDSVLATRAEVNSRQDGRQVLFHRQDLVLGHPDPDLFLPGLQLIQDVLD